MRTALFIAAALLLLILLGVRLHRFLIAPRRGGAERAKPFCRAYAHRGLGWGKNTYPENSLPAFAAAAKAGFGIELDLQLSADGQVFVFHDYTLDRMCGVAGKLAEKTAAELKALRLAGSEEQIPTFAEVLTVVAGRVPLLIELKGESGDTSLCPAMMALLQNYSGTWCVESFNPLLLRWFKKNAPEVVRGILVTDLFKEKKEGSRLVNYMLTTEQMNFLCRPDFVAWDKKYPKGRAFRASLFHGRAASFVFTVKNEEEFAACLLRGDSPIFDSFIPGQNQKSPLTGGENHA